MAGLSFADPDCVNHTVVYCSCGAQTVVAPAALPVLLKPWPRCLFAGPPVPQMASMSLGSAPPPPPSSLTGPGQSYPPPPPPAQAPSYAYGGHVAQHASSSQQAPYGAQGHYGQQQGQYNQQQGQYGQQQGQYGQQQGQYGQQQGQYGQSAPPSQYPPQAPNYGGPYGQAPQPYPPAYSQGYAQVRRFATGLVLGN